MTYVPYHWPAYRVQTLLEFSNAGEPGLVCRARLSIYGTTLLKQIQSNESRSAKEENEAGIQYVQDVSGSRVQVIRRCENDVDAQMQRKILVGTKNE